ncbi:zinc finger BED domain-containing protein 5-like [Odontesthes bonariensis]|uniref:zinc finger BED domain-containing protein 5-like n=1 Tax=Odontesthes bonariensis TaxID=219752 RepID=UPI003F58A8A3
MAKRQGDENAECLKKKKRGYHESYIEFGFIEAMDKIRAECIFCSEKLANESLKPCKLKRHQTTKHPETVGKPKEFFLRKRELVVTNRPQNIKDSFNKAGRDQTQATVASFECSLLIAQAKKPHNIGETLIKPACIKMAELLCGPQVANKFKTLPLSNNTVKDRIDRMAGNVENTLVEKIKTGPFSVQLDETTTVAQEAILVVYVQYIEETELKQDILMSVNLTGTTRGEDIFSVVDTYFTKHNIPYKNVVACCTDGAAAMMGKNKGFNSRLKEKAPHCLVFHCMIHRQALAGKHLCEDLNATLKTVVKIVNFIKARPVNKRIFAQLCEDEAHQTLLLHTEVRWLSRGRVLVRFMELKNQIREFLTVHNQKLSDEMTDEFLIKTSYLTEIFSLYNEANKRMQAADANVMECKETVDAFVRKVEYRKNKLAKGDLQQFPLLLEQSGGKLPDALARQFTGHMEKLQEEMHSRFSDINEHVSKDAWVMDPFLAKEEDVEYLQAEDELMDIKSNSLCKRFYAEHGYKRFWLVKGPGVTPRLAHHATTRFILPFATTYLSETAFSALVTIKTKARNRLDVHSDFRLAVTKVTPDIPSLVQEIQSQSSH